MNESEAPPEARNLEARRDRIRHLAYHDALTGLPNRLLLKDRLGVALSQALRRQNLVAVLFLDLDGFKQVNDRLGHEAGDRLLQEVAARLSRLTRSGDTLARLGGDEFVMVLVDLLRSKDVVGVAGKIVAALHEPFVLPGQGLHVTASVGVSFAPGDGVEADVLVANADAAMYRAKEKGGDTFELFTPDLSRRAADRRALAAELGRALGQGELSLAFQPVVDLATGEISSMEALARWSSQDRGPVAPAEFISVAEDAGLIVGLGRWVLRSACLQALPWVSGDGRRPSLTVNVSSQELQHPDFLPGVEAILSDVGFPPNLLQLDILPGSGPERSERDLSILGAVKGLGVATAADDFGTAGSSLETLRQFPFDVFKIPISFLGGIPGRARDEAIVKSAIRLGRVLDARVVAKGVERDDQLDFLRYHQCDAVQGYLLCAPAPAEAFDSGFFGPSALRA
jgi:diguanylate cyclase (GGDEF)-like protein